MLSTVYSTVYSILRSHCQANPQFNAAIYAETEILDVRESKSKPDRGIVYVETKAYNQDGKKVLTLRRHVLIPKKEFDNEKK